VSGLDRLLRPASIAIFGASEDFAVDALIVLS